MTTPLAHDADNRSLAASRIGTGGITAVGATSVRRHCAAAVGCRATCRRPAAGLVARVAQPGHRHRSYWHPRGASGAGDAPRPMTTARALIAMLLSLLVGGAAGLLMRSRWVMLRLLGRHLGNQTLREIRRDDGRLANHSRAMPTGLSAGDEGAQIPSPPGASEGRHLKFC